MLGIKLAAAYRKALYTLKRNRELALVNSGNTGAFYRYVNSKLKSKVSVAPLSTPSGDDTSDPIVKAELLNEYFSSIFKLIITSFQPALSNFLYYQSTQFL